MNQVITQARSPHWHWTESLSGPFTRGEHFDLPDGSVLCSRRSLTLFVDSGDPEDECRVYREQHLPITLVADSHEEAMEALSDIIPALWQDYALEEDSKLTPRAQYLKELLLAFFFVIR